MRLRRSYIFCFITFVIFDVLQAKSLSYKILINKSIAKRNDMKKITTSERLNKNNHSNKQLHNKCVELSENILCMIYKNKEKLSGLKKQMIKHPEGLVDITRLKDLRFLTGITRTSSNIDKFSEDYLDIGDLATRKEADIFDNPNNLYSKLKLIIDSFQSKNGITPKIERSRKVNVADLINFIDFRSHSTDTSEESMEKKKKKPKRFEVVENSDESAASGNTDSDETSNEMSIPSRNKNINSKIIYVQGPTRHILSDERRSRIPHFMPKRYHWDLDDIKDLPYFWFNGPQGYFAGVYKVFI